MAFGVAGAVAVAGVGIGAVIANTSGLDTWMSGMNHNRIIQVQNEGGVQADSGRVGIAFFSNSSFQITSPRGIRIMVDPWRNDPSGAWGLWYRMDFPKAEVDIGMSTHAHFDHDALGRLESNMLLDRMAGTFKLGDVTLTGIADKHQCIAPGIVTWTDAVKQFEGRENVCPPTNARHFDNNLYVIETGGMRFLMWGDNRPEPPQEIWDRIGSVDVIFVPVDGSRSALEAAWTFVKEGVRHILEGTDHVLFVLCLVLGAATLSALAWRVTGFTIGHSVTLALGFFGHVPTGTWFIPLVETGIALSIVYAAAVSLIAVGHRMTTLVTASLGLLHGLGFSFVLSEMLNLESPNLWQSLLAFNAGIEVGQLLIVLALWPLLVFVAKRIPKRIVAVRWAVALPCILVATIWTGERTMLFIASL